jgi:cobalt-zinc-cadmium efflux system outer membrane protein
MSCAPWVWHGFALLLVLPTASTTAPPSPGLPPGTAKPLHTAAATTPPALTLEQAVAQALVNNPLLMTMRQQRGIAAAGVVIANTYPFNPVYQLLLMGDNGPAEAAVTNKVFHEHILRLDLEVCGQGRHRRAAAQAALSRAEWDIANQEVLTAIGTIRAFNTVLYRADKLKVMDTTVLLNEQAVEQVRRLVGAGGRLRSADLVLARSDVDAARSARGPGRTALAVARADLRRFLGSLDDSLVVNGTLDLPPMTGIDLVPLTETALRQRPDVQARHAAVAEAEARWRLEKANRFGNPSVGPAAEYNETQVTFIGVSLVTPIPLLNRRQGEIQQRQAEVMRARQELTQFEIQARQEVLSALARLADARATADNFRNEVLPNLQRARAELERLFARGEPGLDALRILDVRHRILKAYDSYLDALYEFSQARADLAAAVGDPSLAIPLHSALPEPKRVQP